MAINLVTCYQQVKLLGDVIRIKLVFLYLDVCLYLTANLIYSMLQILTWSFPVNSVLLLNEIPTLPLKTPRVWP